MIKMLEVKLQQLNIVCEFPWFFDMKFASTNYNQYKWWESY